MELIPGFNPTSAKSGQFTAATLQPGSTVIINNKSYVNMIFTFASGDQRLVLANDRRALKFAGASAGPGPVVKWAQESIDYPQTINQLENVVYVEIYAASEIVAETYPTNIQRETLPQLVPTNVGYTKITQDNALVSLSSPIQRVIWPTSYIGLAVAPFNALTGGFGFDYFWSFQRLTSPTMVSLPGQYPSTTKSVNDATSVNETGMSNVAGPFSLPGLTAIDTGTHLGSGSHWTTATILPWNTGNGWWVEMWFNIDQPANGITHRLFGDGNQASNTGVKIAVSPIGEIIAIAGFTGGSQLLKSSAGTIKPNTWYQVIFYYDTTISVPNTLYLYLNGKLVTSALPTGTAVNAVVAPWIGGNATDNASLEGGSMANIGILFGGTTGPYATNLTPQARFEHAQQSLNVDYQNAWINKISINAFNSDGTNPTTSIKVTLFNTYNYGGLLSVGTDFSQDALHTINTYQSSKVYFVGNMGINSGTTYIEDEMLKPLTHKNDSFPYFKVERLFGSTNDPNFVLGAQGYNILGIV
jgi:hypothetical protein